MPATTSPESTSSPRWVGPALLSAGAAMVAVLRVANPNAAGSLLPPCPFHWLTGIYCPGCGSTRCLYSLVHFDLPGAMAMNPLLVLSLPFVALLLANQFFTLPTAWRSVARRIGDARPWAVVLITYAAIKARFHFQAVAWNQMRRHTKLHCVKRMKKLHCLMTLSPSSEHLNQLPPLLATATSRPSLRW